jgi:hypothetical protein
MEPKSDDFDPEYDDSEEESDADNFEEVVEEY